MDFTTTRTYANLMSAFVGESQARTKYDIFSKQAEKQGYIDVKDIFTETAKNEMAHAKLFLELIHGGQIPETVKNLENAANGEKEEWSEIYSKFAQEAAEEGFTEIAGKFRLVSSVEKTHEERYRKLKNDIENDNMFASCEKQCWVCLNCGYVHIGEDAPQKCPLCSYPQAYFKKQASN